MRPDVKRFEDNCFELSKHYHGRYTTCQIKLIGCDYYIFGVIPID